VEDGGCVCLKVVTLFKKLEGEGLEERAKEGERTGGRKRCPYLRT